MAAVPDAARGGTLLQSVARLSNTVKSSGRIQRFGFESNFRAGVLSDLGYGLG